MRVGLVFPTQDAHLPPLCRTAAVSFKTKRVQPRARMALRSISMTPELNRSPGVKHRNWSLFSGVTVIGLAARTWSGANASNLPHSFFASVLKTVSVSTTTVRSTWSGIRSAASSFAYPPRPEWWPNLWKPISRKRDRSPSRPTRLTLRRLGAPSPQHCFLSMSAARSAILSRFVTRRMWTDGSARHREKAERANSAMMASPPPVSAKYVTCGGEGVLVWIAAAPHSIADMSLAALMA
mmetsp:Transcript_101173/g.286819  ORF Transcript_101173/g.286819 Transcript_101173/m.286819 type:complete len:238 (-) Transcript_101173:85-798(-)